MKPRLPSAQLRQLGFYEDSSETASMVRWKTQEVILDVLPSDPNILGFGDEWLQPALEHAAVIRLEPGMRIRMVTAPLRRAIRACDRSTRLSNPVACR